jgi:hypothetical protein
MSAGESLRVTAAPPTTTAAGRPMFPEPRTTLARMLNTQTALAPANTRLE